MAVESADARRLKAELSRHRGRRCPVELRRKAVLYTVARRAAGSTYGQVAGELGVSPAVLWKWRQTYAGTPSAAALVPVEVIPDAVLCEKPVIVLPGGARVEGLSLDDIAVILRRLAA